MQGFKIGKSKRNDIVLNSGHEFPGIGAYDSDKFENL